MTEEKTLSMFCVRTVFGLHGDDTQKSNFCPQFSNQMVICHLLKDTFQQKTNHRMTANSLIWLNLNKLAQKSSFLDQMILNWSKNEDFP